MLHDLDKTIEKILREDGKIPNKDIDIEFDAPLRDWSSKLSRPALNCWAFDVRENLKLRRPDFPRQTQSNGRNAIITKPSRRMDVSYLVTAWARKPEDEHALLWRSLRTLKSIPEIGLDRCQGDLRFSNYPLPIVVADMSQQAFNITDLWSVIDNEMKLGFLAIITVELAVDFAIETPLVLEATIRVSQEGKTPGDEPEPEKPSVSTVRLTETETSDEQYFPKRDVEIVHRADPKEDES